MTIRILKITDPGLCLPLGPAKVKPEPEKVDPIKAFEMGDHKTLLCTGNPLPLPSENSGRMPITLVGR